MKRNRRLIWVSSMIILLAGGCSPAFLPTTKESVQTVWGSFEEAKEVFEKIILNETTTEDLKRLGFDPLVMSNMELLTHLDIVQRFMPNPSITREDLDAGLQECILARENCRAYEISLKKIKRKRLGNVLLDLFGFRRQVNTTGWRFQALIVINDDRVIYKLWSGKPKIEETIVLKKPLGPLQNSDWILHEAVRYQLY